VDPRHPLAVDRDRDRATPLVEQAAEEAGELVAVAVADQTSSMSANTDGLEQVELADHGAERDGERVGCRAASRLPSITSRRCFPVAGGALEQRSCPGRAGPDGEHDVRRPDRGGGGLTATSGNSPPAAVPDDSRRARQSGEAERGAVEQVDERLAARIRRNSSESPGARSTSW
jgi:hypothetical protein